MLKKPWVYIGIVLIYSCTDYQSISIDKSIIDQAAYQTPHEPLVHKLNLSSTSSLKPWVYLLGSLGLGLDSVNSQTFGDCFQNSTELQNAVDAYLIDNSNTTSVASKYGHPINNETLNWYYGPSDFKVLNAYGKNLDELVPFGWGLFGWINRYIFMPLFAFLGGFLPYGIAIIVMTALKYNKSKKSASMA